MASTRLTHTQNTTTTRLFFLFLSTTLQVTITNFCFLFRNYNKYNSSWVMSFPPFFSFNNEYLPYISPSRYHTLKNRTSYTLTPTSSHYLPPTLTHYFPVLKKFALLFFALNFSLCLLKIVTLAVSSLTFPFANKMSTVNIITIIMSIIIMIITTIITLGFFFTFYHFFTLLSVFNFIYKI